MKKRMEIVFVTLMCSLLCSASPEAKEPIHIGLSAPMTGQYAGYVDSFKKAIDLAIETINKSGGIDGRPIELIVMDSQGDQKIAKRIARKFAEDKRIIAEIGDLTSTCCMAASTTYQRAGLLQLSPTASHPSFAPGSPFSFSVAMTQETIGPIMARNVVKKLNKKRLGVLYLNTDWGVAVQKFFTEAAKGLGAEIVALEYYLEGVTDFKPVLEKLKASNPDILFTILLYRDGVAVSKQRQEIGWNDVAMAGTSALYTRELLELGGDAVENLYTFATFFPKDPRTEVQDFVKGYQARYETSADLFAARAYDAMNLLTKAIIKGGTDRKAVRDALAATKDFPGTTGKITFDRHGNVVKEVVLLQVRNGEFVLYSEK
ncbi:ABC transporter substrate-binding protein [Desulfobacterales bacterium HSG2]|nr:ABC transporter substrate-binding protein [Desulfobacterales bacterium HSG2]